MLRILICGGLDMSNFFFEFTYTMINLDASWTIRALKDIIQEGTGVPSASQRLIFAGKQLQDDWFVIINN